LYRTLRVPNEVADRATVEAESWNITFAWCPWGSHRWIRDRQGERPLIVPLFLQDGGPAMVQVRCLKCEVVTRMDLDEFEAGNPIG